MRSVRPRPILLALGVLVLLGGGALAPAAAADDPGAVAASGAAVIDVPYGEPATIEPAAPWTVADCAGPQAASALVTACDPTRIELASPDYDPEAGTVALPVVLTDGHVSTTVTYRLRLEPPAAPTLAVPGEARPVASGSLLLVPFSDLGARCTRCAGGAALGSVTVDPPAAGAAWATPTHLVFRAAQSFTGPVELGFTVLDEFGTEAAGTVPIGVYRGAQPLIALDVFVPLEASGAASVDLAGLVTSIAGDEVVFVGCGATLHGVLACTGDGAATYTGTGEPDQFGFRVAAGGEQASGSVTFVPVGAEDAGSGPVPAARPSDDEPVTTRFTPQQPVEQSADGGAFDPLIALLDRTAR